MNKRSLLILGITAIVLSRALFFFFNDPEGPNLLVVMVAAAIVYFVSLTAYAFNSSANESKRSWLAILIQIVVVAVLYFLGVTF